jgi:hypothetical protein
MLILPFSDEPDIKSREEVSGSTCYAFPGNAWEPSVVICWKSSLKKLEHANGLSRINLPHNPDSFTNFINNN